MTAIAQPLAQGSDAVAPGPAKPPPARKPFRLRTGSDRGFRRALAAAVLLHLTLLVSFIAAPESLTRQRLGEPDADPEGVSVEIVDMADLKSRSNAPLKGGAPDQPAQQPQQRPPQPQQEPQQHEEQQEPQQQPQQQPQAAEPQRQPPPKEKAREKAEAVEAPGTPPPPPSEAPAEQPRPAPPQKQASRPPAPSAQPQQPPRVLDLRVPPSALNITPRDFGASRPPGTTRSGENDQFFKGVIRALWRTFPELRTTGIVGIRFLLNNKGNLVSITVTRTSGDPTLDQSVVFAAKQASFPLPPDNATEIDRTFLITYIYR